MECGECTLCCDLLPIKELNKPANILCEYCELKKGCKIQETKPLECRNFDCAYYQMEKVHIDLRPDNCKVIFEKVSDRVFFGTQDPRFEVTDIAKNQIAAFGNQGISVILVSSKEKKPAIILAPGHTVQQVMKEFQEYLNN